MLGMPQDRALHVPEGDADRAFNTCADHAAQAFAALMEGDGGRGPLPGDSLTVDTRRGCYLCAETQRPGDAVLALDWALSVLQGRREAARVTVAQAKRAAEAAEEDA